MASFDELSARLVDEAKDLFCHMAELHLAGGPKDRFFGLSQTMAGDRLSFHSRSPNAPYWSDEVDYGLLLDLARWSILSVEHSRNSRLFRVTSDGVNFYRHLMEERGQPIDQVDHQVRTLVGSDEFAARFAGAARHLNEAFELLWRGDTADQTVSDLGSHLRHALMDVVDVLCVGDGADPEKPVDRLKVWLAAAQLNKREREVLEEMAELARKAQSLNMRLNHVRNEVGGKAQPAASWEEMRRAAFTTAFLCAELARLRV